jgi:electron transport complex protein RnfD
MMPLKEKILSVFNSVKGDGKLWWLNLNDEYPRVIMLDVIIALLPACIFGCILFGIKALLVLLTSCATAVLSEFLWNLIFKKPQTVKDFSALLTGLLFGMCMPDNIPLWIVVIGSVFAIIVVKQLLGGLGYNLTNPAVTSVILLKFCFSKALTSYHLPFYHTAEKTVDYSFSDLFFGLHSGSIGETCSFLLIVGGVYLIIRKIISPIVPLTFIGSVAFLSLVFSQNILYDLLGGTLILGAFFMANDYTTSPTTKSGKVIFGLGCGIFSFIIHIIFKGYDGVLFAILIMNILLALYNRLGIGKYKEKGIEKLIELSKQIKPLSIKAWQQTKKFCIFIFDKTKTFFKNLKKK